MSRSILGMPMFRELCNSLHQGEDQPDIELYSFSFILYYTTWISEKKKENCGWGEGEMGEIGQPSIKEEWFSIFYLCCSHYFYLDC